MKYVSKLLARGSLLSMMLVCSSCNPLDYFKQQDNKPAKTPAAETSKASSAAPVTDSQDTSVSLCSVNGESVITEKTFEESVKQILQANPYFRNADFKSLPPEIIQKLFQEQVKQELIIAEGTKNGIESDAEFIKAYQDMDRLIKRSMKVDFFQKKIFDGIEVSGKDVEKYFNENKDRFVKSPGGVLVEGVAFDDEAKADAFLKKTKEATDSFEKIGNEADGGSYKDYGRVNDAQGQQAYRFDVVPAPVKKAALAATKMPTIEKVKADKKFYVVKASDKQNTVYFSLDEVRPQVEATLKNNLFKEELDRQIQSLRDKYDVITNDDYFKKSGSENPQFMESDDEASIEAAESAAAEAA